MTRSTAKLAEIKYDFPGISKMIATMLLSALAASKLAWLTTGIVGQITFFFLTKAGRWLANHGLVLANIGYDSLKIADEKKDFDSAMDKALEEILSTKRKLTKEEREKIDEPVKKAFRRFGTFV